jgi:hypothetical protein
MSYIVKSAAFAVALAAAPVSAATLDFSGVQDVIAPQVVLSNATITNTSGGNVFVGSGAAGSSDGFCFLSPSFNCENDGEIVFSSAVTALTFDIDGADRGDSVEITAFLGATSLGSLTFTANGVADFSSFGSIDRLVFDDSSTAAGVGYSTFSFNAPTGVVPLPAAAPLLLGGLAALGLAARRRRA